MNLLLATAMTAGGAIAAHRLVKFSAANTVVVATAGADAVIGATTDLAVVSGERVDVITHGSPDVVAGAAVTRGALVMSDDQGRAITAAASAGANVRTAGVALDSADAAGDVIRVRLAPGSFQGAA